MDLLKSRPPNAPLLMDISIRFFSDPLLNTVAWGCFGWWALVETFVASMAAKEVIKSGETIPMMFYVPLLLGALVGLVLDIVLLNWLLGPFIYHEFRPREFTFTAHTQRMIDTKKPHDRMYLRALWWGVQLNKIDPRHVKGI